MTKKKAKENKGAKKAPVRPKGKSPLDGVNKLYILGAVAIMLIISIALAYGMQGGFDFGGNAPESGVVNSQGSTDGAAAPASGETAGANGAAGEADKAAEAWPKDSAVRLVEMETDQGKIVMEVYPDLMPITVENFLKLVEAKFYDGLTFHRVEDWVIQGGDPQGNGTGGPGWTIKLETNPELKNVRGAVAMARSQEPDTAGSQFYILKKDASGLDGKYAVFGRVVQGMEVVDGIKPGDKMSRVTVQ